MVLGRPMVVATGLCKRFSGALQPSGVAARGVEVENVSIRPLPFSCDSMFRASVMPPCHRFEFVPHASAQDKARSGVVHSCRDWRMLGFDSEVAGNPRFWTSRHNRSGFLGGLNLHVTRTPGAACAPVTFTHGLGTRCAAFSSCARQAQHWMQGREGKAVAGIDASRPSAATVL